MWKKPNRSGEYADGIPAELRGDFGDFKIIGGGTYGTVYKASPKLGGPSVALKKIKLYTNERIMSMSLPATAMREILILRELAHPNIVALRDVYFKPASLSLWLWFDHCPLDLRVLVKYIHKAYLQLSKPTATTLGLQQQLVVRFAQQLFSGMEFVHKLNIIHRDLKPQNILMNDAAKPVGDRGRAAAVVDPELRKALLTIPDAGKVCVQVLENALHTVAQIADFGLSRSCKIPSQQLTHEVVTLWYRAPEILLGCEIYSNAIDVWSLGCIIAEMVSGKPLFAGDSEIDTLFRIFRLLGTPAHPGDLGFAKLTYFQESFPRWPTTQAANAIADSIYKPPAVPNPLLIDLVGSCLRLNPEERITCSEALKHPFFKT